MVFTVACWSWEDQPCHLGGEAKLLDDENSCHQEEDANDGDKVGGNLAPGAAAGEDQVVAYFAKAVLEGSEVAGTVNLETGSSLLFPTAYWLSLC